MNRVKTLAATLSEVQLKQLMERYYLGEDISLLINDYNLSIPASQITRLFPPEVLSDVTCPYCDGAMRRPRVSRHALSKANSRPLYCEVCGHKTRSCKCAGCLIVRKEKERERERSIRDNLSTILTVSRTTEVAIEDLSLWQAVTLIAFDRSLLREDDFVACNIQWDVRPLAPTKASTADIVMELYRASLIDISIDSPIDSFNIEDDKVVFSPEHVNWRLHVGPTIASEIGLLRRIKSKIDYVESWTDAWINELNQVAQRVALYEALYYLQIRQKDHGLDFTPGEKTTRIFLDILNNFSLSQLYNFIWTAVRDAAAYYLRGGISRKQAANSVVGGCARRADRARAEGWSVKQYRRDYRTEESELTAIVRNIVAMFGAEFYETRWVDVASK